MLPRELVQRHRPLLNAVELGRRGPLQRFRGDGGALLVLPDLTLHSGIELRETLHRLFCECARLFELVARRSVHASELAEQLGLASQRFLELGHPFARQLVEGGHLLAGDAPHLTPSPFRLLFETARLRGNERARLVELLRRRVPDAMGLVDELATKGFELCTQGVLELAEPLLREPLEVCRPIGDRLPHVIADGVSVLLDPLDLRSRSFLELLERVGGNLHDGVGLVGADCVELRGATSHRFVERSDDALCRLNLLCAGRERFVDRHGLLWMDAVLAFEADAARVLRLRRQPGDVTQGRPYAIERQQPVRNADVHDDAPRVLELAAFRRPRHAEIEAVVLTAER